MLLMYLNQAYTMFVVNNLLYEEKKKQIISIINEITILLTIYHFFCFTDFVADADTKDTFVGITMVGLTFVNMGVNLIPLTLQSLNLVLSKARKRYIKIKHLRKKRVYKQRKLKKERLTIEFVKERQIL